jgi:hypothetical protein
MKLASVFREYADAFLAKYGPRLLPSHHTALRAILSCRTPNAGTVHVQHCSQCGHHEWRPLSCGPRSCPQCQHHDATEWLERQQAKLLPVEYFLVTFTLPYELRSGAWHHQSVVYQAFFDCVSETLQAFGANPKHLGAELGRTAVLHTHNRRLDYHPPYPCRGAGGRNRPPTPTMEEEKGQVPLPRRLLGPRLPRQIAQCPASGGIPPATELPQEMGRGLHPCRQRKARPAVPLALPLPGCPQRAAWESGYRRRRAMITHHSPLTADRPSL